MINLAKGLTGGGLGAKIQLSYLLHLKTGKNWLQPTVFWINGEETGRVGAKDEQWDTWKKTVESVLRTNCWDEVISFFRILNKLDTTQTLEW